MSGGRYARIGKEERTEDDNLRSISHLFDSITHHISHGTRHVEVVRKKDPMNVDHSIHHLAHAADAVKALSKLVHQRFPKAAKETAALKIAHQRMLP
jgi:uncharacterized protein YjaG (DUF416 family)